MNRDEIKTFLPHREPMLLVDDSEVHDGVCTAHYHVRGDEHFLQGHFPGNPVVPGVILCEIMGQSCCTLIKDDLPGRTPFYAGLDEVRFKRPVRPGDTITIEGKITANKGLTFFVEAKATVEGQLACKGKLLFTLIDNK
ncbi:MAG: 3-hydroxyacyl-ACP dehydratase FabZ [Bacteroidales bacterium]|nr:3-hydroxyacyl-ACP dehydratase FabZ [Bacteroidales bacterium]